MISEEQHILKRRDVICRWNGKEGTHERRDLSFEPCTPYVLEKNVGIVSNDGGLDVDTY